MKDKPYNSGQWTEARFNSFIMSALRRASVKWPPRSEAKKKAKVCRGYYMCAGHGHKPHIVPASLPSKNGRAGNVFVDHVEPVVYYNPSNNWNSIIDRMFCEVEGLQILCGSCHKKKSKEESDERQKRKKNS